VRVDEIKMKIKIKTEKIRKEEDLNNHSLEKMLENKIIRGYACF